jgi:flagella basal body P-ring formation protein FlgA
MRRQHRAIFIHLFLATLVVIDIAQAEAPFRPEIRILGREQVVVNRAQVKLEDIADVQSVTQTASAEISRLKALEIAKAPTPGDAQSFTALEVLEKIRAHGVDTTKIGYSFPRFMKVERAGRSIEKNEIAAVIEQVLAAGGRDAQVRNVQWPAEMKIAPGVPVFEAIEFDRKPRRSGFQMRVAVADEAPVRFNAYADLEEWREVVVAARSVGRGELLQDEDFSRARMNVGTIPIDAISESNDLAGMEVEHALNEGEILRKRNLRRPAVIPSGSKVVAVFKGGAIEATATATALEDGMHNQVIKIRNESSKKILEGTVIEPGLVRINR